MPYLLEHHFDPDFDHQRLVPQEDASGRVDHFDLGYVQNVAKHSVLAEFREIDAALAAERGGRFVYDEPVFPAGANTLVDPHDPLRLLAAADGYVFYFENKITVKTLLNVRGNVDYRTGNIRFVGDVVLHGDVRAGFRIQAKNVLVKGSIESAVIRASGSILAEGGVRGGNEPDEGYLRAGGGMRLAFCQNCRIKAGDNLLVQGSALHNDISVRGKCAVKDKLIGGRVTCPSVVYVGNQLGGGLSTETIVELGFDPFLMLREEAIDRRLEELEDQWRQWEILELRGGALMDELAEKKARANGVLQALRAKKREFEDRLDEQSRLSTCRLVVPGEVRPGVTVTMGSETLSVKDYLRDVAFFYRDGEIRYTSPAMKKK